MSELKFLMETVGVYYGGIRELVAAGCPLSRLVTYPADRHLFVRIFCHFCCRFGAEKNNVAMKDGLKTERIVTFDSVLWIGSPSRLVLTPPLIILTTYKCCW